MAHMSENPTKQRLRITFGKFGALKYTSNLDVAKIWERVLRRAGLPLLYTQGFNTRPKLQLASALPLGITSECELLDIALKEIITLDGVVERLTAVSPDGLKIFKIEDVDIYEPALQTRVRSAEYHVHFESEIDLNDVQTRIQELLARETILKSVKRKRRTIEYDLRPLIYQMALESTGDLIMQIAVGAQGNLRPDDALQELGLDDTHHRIHRARLVLE